MLMLAALFQLLTSYYLLKTAREGLVLSTTAFRLSGDELKTYATGAMALLVMLLVPAYDMLANRLRRIVLVNVSIGLVLACLVVFYVLARVGVPIGLAFYVWLGIASVFLIAQFWSFANDFYSEEQGERLFGTIAVGGSLGAIVGPWLSQLGSTNDLMVLGLALLVGYVVVLNVVERLGDDAAPRCRIRTDVDGRGGFSLVLRDRYLVMVALLLLVLNLINTTGDYILSNAILEHATRAVAHDPQGELARRELIKTLYGDFFLHVNIAAFVLQAALVSPVIALLGVRRALFVLPLVAVGAYGSVAMLGTFGAVRTAKLATGSTDYSLHNTVRQMLFLPLTPGAKFKAKAAIDTFFVRVGDSLSAVLVAVAIHALALGRRALAIVNIALVAVWLVICAAIARRHRAIAHAA